MGNEMNEVLKTRIALASLPWEVRRQLERSSTTATLSEIWSECGFQNTLSFADYAKMFERNGIARRVISAPCNAVWKKAPLLVDLEAKDAEKSPLVKGWNQIVQQRRVFHYLNRADVVSGIGRYGILVLGFNDGRSMDQPVKKGSKLMYLSVFSEQNAQIQSFESDLTQERYGMPKYYTVQLSSEKKPQLEFSERKVHWERVLHLSEGLLEDDVYGTPRLQEVYNNLHSLEKIIDGSGEMFWKGAFPGTAWIMPPEAERLTAGELEDLKEEIESYHKNLQRYVKVQGLVPQQLSPNVADPTAFFMLQVMCVAAAKKIPLRILLGSERGEMASAQDEKTWQENVSERQLTYVEPMILNPFIERLQYLNVLPEGEYQWDWPDLHAPSRKDRAMISETQSRTLINYLSAPGAEFLLPPDFFLSHFLELSPKQIEHVKDQLAKMDMDMEDLPPMQMGEQQGGGSNPLEDGKATEEGDMEAGKLRKKAGEKELV